MTSRDAMLAAIRSARRPPMARPDVAAAIRALPPAVDLSRGFAAAAAAAGARVIEGRRADMTALIASAYEAAGRQVSVLDAVAESLPTPTPHSFADTDVFVCEAELGVAENGAVWLPLSRLHHRSAVFLATSVIVILDPAHIVGTFHDAYAMIDASADGFGVFVAGPSKTADIEQSLVIGAHGAKSVTVLLLEQ